MEVEEFVDEAHQHRFIGRTDLGDLLDDMLAPDDPQVVFLRQMDLPEGESVQCFEFHDIVSLS